MSGDSPAPVNDHRWSPARPKPACTSSATTSAPADRAAVWRASWYAAPGAWIPSLVYSGSTMTRAGWWPASCSLPTASPNASVPWVSACGAANRSTCPGVQPPRHSSGEKAFVAVVTPW